MEANEANYLMQGHVPVETASSLLISSSRYLNHPGLRAWVASECLRRNGRDIPATYTIPELIRCMYEVQDTDHVNALLAKARNQWPALDRWFEERFFSTFTREDLKQYPAGSLGKAFSDYLEEWDFQLELGSPSESVEGDYRYFQLRVAQMHDIEHILGGGGFDALGEGLPDFMRISSYFKFFEPELAKELGLVLMFLMNTMISRTFLHYPETWPAMWERMNAGFRIGEQSEAFFLARYEDYFHLPVAEARRRLGIRGAEERDTFALSDIWSEGAMSAMKDAARRAAG